MPLLSRGRSANADADVVDPQTEAPTTAPDVGAPEPGGHGARWRPSKLGYAARIVVLLFLLGLVIAVPHLLPSVFVLIVATACVYMLLALSMNTLMGYAGQVSLGHAAFLGFGAFAAGYVLTIMRMPWPAALLAAMLMAGIAAAGLGAIALRIRGLYLALVTIAFGLFAQETLFKIRSLTGGGAGQPAPRPSFAQTDIQYVYVGYVLVAIVWFLDWRLTSTKAGRAIQALRDDERVAASWGINVTAFKLLAFIISGVVAGMAGAYFAGIEQIVSPASITFTLSLTVVLLTVVGGLGSRPGVIQGGILFAVLPTLLDEAHKVKSWGGGDVPNAIKTACTSAPPRAIQGVIGGVMLLAALGILVAAIRHRGSIGKLLGSLIAVGVLGFLGQFLLRAAFTRDWCVFSEITALWEPFIAAMLLVLTLIFFPGGIAQQQAHTLRWLSFKPLHEPEQVAVSGGEGGSGHGRP